jgi:hypothetical protein
MNVAWLRKRLGRAPPRAIDLGLAVVVAVAVTIAINVAREPGARPADAISYALGLTIAALVVVRRRWPLAVLAASAVTLQAYYILNYPQMSAAVPLAVALYTATAVGHLRWALLVAAWFWGVGFLGRAFLPEPEPLVPILNDLVRDGSLLVAVLLLGDTVRSRRMARESHEQELRVAQSIQQRFLPKEPRAFPDGTSPLTISRRTRSVGTSTTSFSYPAVRSSSALATSRIRASRRRS